MLGKITQDRIILVKSCAISFEVEIAFEKKGKVNGGDN